MNSWNLLLFVPLLALLTPLFNRVNPKLFGMPFFYWFQILNIFVGVALTSLVYMTTRDDDYFGGRPDRYDADRYDPDRYDPGRYDADRYDPGRYDSDRRDDGGVGR